LKLNGNNFIKQHSETVKDQISRVIFSG